MRTRTLLLIGLIAAPSLVLLNMQGSSVAASEVASSRNGAIAASVLVVEPEIEEPKVAVRPQRGHSLRYSDVIKKKNTSRKQKMIEQKKNEHEESSTQNDDNLREIAKKYAATSGAEEKKTTALLPAIARADAEDYHKQLVNEVLMSLPSKCRETLQNFYVKYEKQKHRGLAGKTVMILDGTVKNEEEFRALFIHETGHNFDLGCLKGTPEAGKSSFSDGSEAIYKDDPSVGFYSISWITSEVQRSNSNPEDFVSGYAATNVFEDFAEGFGYFLLHNEEFLKRAQTNEALAKKYVWFRNVMFDGVVPQIATGHAPFKKKVPWDTTKLDYAWHPHDLVVQK